MKTTYETHDSKANTLGVVETIKIDLTPKGQLNRISIVSRSIEEKYRHIAMWGTTINNEWDFKDATEEELIKIFESFALKNPEEFQMLYYELRRNDPKIFPIIKKALEKTKQKFSFY